MGYVSLQLTLVVNKLILFNKSIHFSNELDAMKAYLLLIIIVYLFTYLCIKYFNGSGLGNIGIICPNPMTKWVRVYLKGTQTLPDFMDMFNFQTQYISRSLSRVWYRSGSGLGIGDLQEPSQSEVQVCGDLSQGVWLDHTCFREI